MPFECPVPSREFDRVTLAHGGGGKLTQKLISDLFVPALAKEHLRALHDGAVLTPSSDSRLAFTTDSFVIQPLFFPGGDIGSLSVHGTANDLAMCGARPRFLALSFILEEGFELERLEQIVASIGSACRELDLEVVTGDTKVVERGSGDGVFINTTGIGDVLPQADISPWHVRTGDRVLLSGPIAEHGIAILSVREGLSFETTLESDSAALWPLVERMLDHAGRDIHVLRDATRGGVASVLCEIADSAKLGIVVDDRDLPVREDVRGACEMLGLDPLYVANEGKCVCFAEPSCVGGLLRTMRSHPLGREARVIGEVVSDHPGVVRLRSSFGGSRVIDRLSGEQLPRIC